MSNDTQSKSEKKTLSDFTESLVSSMIWIIGVIFIAGMIYTKVIDNEESVKESENKLQSMTQSQIRVEESIKRIEISNISFNREMLASLNEIKDDLKETSERSIRNELKIESLENQVKALGGK